MRALDNERKESDLSEGRARQTGRPVTSSEYYDPRILEPRDRGVAQGLTLLYLSVMGWCSGLVRNSPLGGLRVVTVKGRVGVRVWGAPRLTNLAGPLQDKRPRLATPSQVGAGRLLSLSPSFALYLLSACGWLC